MTEEQVKLKEDKRKKTSAQNLAKARKSKLEKLKKDKEEKASQYQILDDGSDSESSSSDDDAIIIKSKKKKQPKKKPIETDPIKQELAELREIITNLTLKKPKKIKPRRSKQVIQIVNPQPEQKKVSPEAELIKQRMLLNFN